MSRSIAIRMQPQLTLTFVTLLWASAMMGCRPVDTEAVATDASKVERLDREYAQDDASDIAGKRHQLFEHNSDRYRVITFVTTDCPIANAYQPTLRKLAEDFSDAKVDFLQVNPTRSTTVEKAKQHVSDFEITSPMILDSDQAIADRLGAKVTPETFLISPTGDVIYRGRIDDLYVGFGKKRQMPTVHDLRDAIESALDSRPISTPVTKPIGCIIQYEQKQAENSKTKH